MLSIDAAGTVAKSLTFARIKGGVIAKSTPHKKSKNTPKERNARTNLQLLIPTWQDTIVPSVITPDWEPLAKQENLPTYNAYLRFNLNKLAAQQGPRWSPTANFGNNPAFFNSITPSVAPGTVQFTADISSIDSLWCVLIFMAIDPADLTRGDNAFTAINVSNATSLIWPSYIVKNLPHGSTWRWAWRQFTTSGTMSAITVDPNPFTVP